MVPFATLAVTILLIFWAKWHIKRRHLPPGPPSIPIFGCVPFVKKMGGKLFSDPSLHKYGKLVRIDMGMLSIIVINDFNLAKELFNSDAITGKMEGSYWQNYIRGHNGVKLGVTHASGERWQVQRRFALRTLRDFGFGKKKLDILIQDEAELLIEDLQKSADSNNGEVLLHTNFSAPIVNVLWKLLVSKRFESNSPETNFIMSHLNNLFKSIFNWKAMVNSLRPYLPLLTYEKNIAKVKNMIRKIIEEHEEVHDSNAEPQDFVDAFLTEIKRDGQHWSFDKEQLIVIIMDLLEAGAETTSTTLMWAVMYMVLNPKVQQKCHDEIDRELGSKLPDQDDMPRLPYVLATIMEIQRVSFVAAGSLPHMSTEDLTIEGYKIPKGSFFVINIRKFMHDPATFSDPDKFDPERFLERDGSVKKYDQFVPFSLGKRMCMGDALAKQELFIFFTMLLQQLNFSETPGCRPDPQKYTCNLTTIPEQFHVNVESRKN